MWRAIWPIARSKKPKPSTRDAPSNMGSTDQLRRDFGDIQPAGRGPRPPASSGNPAYDRRLRVLSGLTALFLSKSAASVRLTESIALFAFVRLQKSSQQSGTMGTTDTTN
jgi:hypothetical protein